MKELYVVGECTWCDVPIYNLSSKSCTMRHFLGVLSNKEVEGA